MRKSVRGRVAAVSAATLLASGLPAVTAPVVAHATANANIHLSSSVTASTSSPVLGLTFTADKLDVTPGDTVIYTSRVTNTGSEWQQGGAITAQATPASDAVVASWYDELEYRDSANRWQALATYAALRPGYTPKDAGAGTGGLTVSATPKSASGVTYPTTGDSVLGTVVGAGKTASWTYSGSAVLTPAQIATLTHAATAVRQTVHLEVTPRNSNAAQPASDVETVTNPLQSGTSSTVTDASIAVTRPDGSVATLDKASAAGLASIAPGVTVTAAATYAVPVPGVEKSGESDGTYLARLRALVGKTLDATASAKGTATGAPACGGGDPGHHYGGGDVNGDLHSGKPDPTQPPATPANTVATGIRSVTSTEHLPVLSLTKAGPATVDAGTTANYTLTVANAGDATGSGVSVVDTLPDGSKPAVTGMASSVAAAGTSTGAASYAVPNSQPDGPLTDTATLNWQDANKNAYGPVNASYTTTVHSSYAGATLTLSPANAGPDVVGTSQTLTALLTSASGAVMPGKPVTVTITGANPQHQTLTTGADGTVQLSYTGSVAGDDSVQATVGGTPLASNTATIGWTKPAPAATLSDVTGNFYFGGSSDSWFTASAQSTPVFGEQFPDIAFNPPAGAVPGNITGVGPTTSPFTDVTTDVSGHGKGTIIAAGNGFSAYSGNLKAFDAALTGTLVIAHPGNVTLRLVHSGGAILGIGGSGLQRVAGTVDTAGGPTVSVMQGFSLYGGSGGPGLDKTETFTVGFPAAGSYPIELDYFSTGDVRASLVLSMVDYRSANGSTPGLSVYTGYADTEDPAGAESFPSPFNGSSGTTFVGQGAPYDTGLIRLDNHTDAPVPVSSVTLDIGKKHYDPWADSSLVVPAQGTLMLGSTDGENFDTSDPNGTAPTGAVTGFNVANYVTGIPNVSNAGPVGIATDPLGDFYYTDYLTGHLYEVPEGSSPDRPQAFNPYIAQAVGLAFSASGRLYVLSQSANALYEVSPADGSIVRLVAYLPSCDATALALDPLSGDLFASHPGCGPITRISGYESGSLSMTDYGNTSNIDGITFAPDGTLYGEQGSGSILRIDGTDRSQPPAVTVVANVPTADGVGLVNNPLSPDNPDLIVNANNGTITEVDTSTNPPSQTQIYNGGTRGDLVATGTDGCLYATQTASILKITASDGSCPFETVSCTKLSTVPQVTVVSNGDSAEYDDKQLTLTNGGVDRDHCGNRNESSDWTQIGGPVGAAHPVSSAGTLTLSPEKSTGVIVGQQHTFTVSAVDADGQPLTGTSVDVAVTGSSTGGAVKHYAVVTDATGSASVAYASAHAGTDSLSATALISGARVVSNQATVIWKTPDLPPAPTPTPTASGGPTPTPTGGSGGSGGPAGSGLPPVLVPGAPADGSRITVPTPVTATLTPPDGESITHWSVTVNAAGGAPISVASGTGQPPATLGTLDPTLLSDGLYTLTITADASGGGEQVVTTSVVVDGNLKLGRFAATWHDTDAALGSTSLQLLRTYDSTTKSQSGDFGYGWTLSSAGYKVSTNGALGNGGWSSYDASCFYSICSEGYRTSQPHVVAVTFPDGHVESFDFTPVGQQGDDWLAYARFTARPGTTSTMSPVGDDNILDQGDGSLYDEESGDPYAPTEFLLTTHDGSKLLLDTSAGLVSFTNRAGITYNFSKSGVTSSAGSPQADFQRDAKGRITEIDANGTTHYSYDAAGDLASMSDATGKTTTFTYDDQHDLLSIVGPNSTPLRTMHYDADGRLTSVTDADGNTTDMTDDVDARSQVIKDPAGALTTKLLLDDLGDVLTKTETGDGSTRTTTSTYDAFGRLLTSTDPLGHTTKRTYDDAGDLLTSTDAQGHTRSITYDANGNPLSTVDANGATQSFGYDGGGNLISSTDADGHTTTYAYDLSGRMSDKTDPLGGTTMYGYDAAGNLTSQTDPLGHTTTWTYDSHNHVASTTDPLGMVTTTSYDADGHLLSSTDPSGAVTSSAYDADGNKVTSTDALGNVTKFTYTAADQQESSTDPLGRTIKYGYDADGRQTTVTDPTGAVTTTSYNAFGETASVKDPLGRTTSYGYDAAGHRISVIAANGKATSYAYDAAGNRTSVTDADGNVTRTAYDAMNRPTAVTDADGRTTTTAYTPGGRLASVTDAAGGVTSYTLDSDNRVTATKDALGEITSSVHDAAGELTSTTDPAGRTMTYTYDADGHQLTSTNDLHFSSSYGYDADGRLITTRNADAVVTSYSYDGDGRQTAVTDALGDVSATAYDAAGQMASTTDALGHTTRYAYDAAGRMTSMTDALGGKVVLGYDADGEQTSVTDPDGVTRTFGYDALGNQTSQTDTLGNVQSSEYDAAGRLAKTTDARGQVTTYNYDPAGQETGRTSADGAVTQAFDALGDRTVLTDSTGTSTFTYDAVGRMLSATTPAGAVSYGYDASGLRTDVTAAGAHVGYAYDAAGRLLTVTDASGTTTMGRNASGSLASVTLPNGGQTRYVYDGAGRETEQYGPGGVFVYGLDADGNRIRVDGPLVSSSYTLDADNRLTSSTANHVTTTYGYDAAGNRTSVSSGGATTDYSYDAAGRLAKVGSSAVTVDPDGNITTVGGDTYSYNAAGQLVAASVNGQSASYTVNGDGQRVAAASGGSTDKLVLDVASDLPAVLAETGHRYTRSTDGSLLADTTASGTLFATTDAQGSVAALTNASQQLVGTATYDPYGVITGTTGTTSAFGYTGAVTDGGGNVDLQAREYDPTLGQFLQADSYEVGGPGTAGYNRYTYTADNPTTLVDPLGHEGEGGVAGEEVTESVGENVDGILQRAATAFYMAGQRVAFLLATNAVAAAATDCAGTELLTVADGDGFDASSLSVCLVAASLAKADGSADVSQDVGDNTAVEYGELDSLGRPTGITALLSKDELTPGERARLNPPGFEGGEAGQARGHLLAKRLGGLNDVRNIVTLQQNPTNSPAMRALEAQVAKSVASGDLVYYQVTPIYDGDTVVPVAIHVQATSDSGLNIDSTIANTK